jgi:carbonic anhydrase
MCRFSRATETVFDTGIGDTFIGRVAGNVVNEDMLGSMEFACAAAGANVILVLGHPACGAVKGAIDDVVLGNLTGLLARIKPAIPATKFEGEKSSKNAAYVDAVARTNVVLALAEIRRRSPVLEELEKKGIIQIAGAMYYLTTGVVEFSKLIVDTHNSRLSATWFLQPSPVRAYSKRRIAPPGNVRYCHVFAKVTSLQPLRPVGLRPPIRTACNHPHPAP